MSKNNCVRKRMGLLLKSLICLLAVSSVYGAPQCPHNINGGCTFVKESSVSFGGSSSPIQSSSFSSQGSSFSNHGSGFWSQGSRFPIPDSFQPTQIGNRFPTPDSLQPTHIGNRFPTPDSLQPTHIGNRFPTPDSLQPTHIGNRFPITPAFLDRGSGLPSSASGPFSIDEFPDIPEQGNIVKRKFSSTIVKNGQVFYHAESNNGDNLDGFSQPENKNYMNNVPSESSNTFKPQNQPNHGSYDGERAEGAIKTEITTRASTEKPNIVERPTGDCEKSVTTVNGVPACKKILIFETNFKDDINKNWTNEVHFNQDESEFVVFDNLKTNSFCDSGSLTIRPTLVDDYYGEAFTTTGAIDLTTKCTTKDEVFCVKDNFVSTILTPVISARLTTKDNFSFKYGVVEIKAKLPRGDWVVPELWLQPKAFKPFGAKKSGKVIVAKSIGNAILKHDGVYIGNNLLTAGLEVDDKTKKFKKMTSKGLWSDRFHIYKFEWTPSGMSFHVDDEEFGKWHGNKYSPLLRGDKPEYGPLSPFDQEFYLVLGLHAGGFHDIPNGAVSDDKPKPWNNTDPKRMIRFYEDLKTWYTTWDDKTKLQVDFIRVWSLP